MSMKIEQKIKETEPKQMQKTIKTKETDKREKVKKLDTKHHNEENIKLTFTLADKLKDLEVTPKL